MQYFQVWGPWLEEKLWVLLNIHYVAGIAQGAMCIQHENSFSALGDNVEHE